VAADPYGIGYSGIGYDRPDVATVPLAVDADGPMIPPAPDAAYDGTYPLARPLFIYSTANIMQEKPQVADFINYYLTYVNDEIVDVGYFPASTAAIDEAKAKWLEAMQ
jgi:phosphate transport system substrate-binding protein